MNPKKPILALLLIGSGFVFGALALQAGAFSSPAQSPPNGNVDPPITAGDSWQLKTGRLLDPDSFQGVIAGDPNSEVDINVQATYDQSDPNYVRYASLTAQYDLDQVPLVFGLPGSDCTVRLNGITDSYPSSGVYSSVISAKSGGLLSFSCKNPELAVSKTVVLKSKSTIVNPIFGNVEGNQMNTLAGEYQNTSAGDLQNSGDFYVPGTQGSVLIAVCTISGNYAYSKDDGSYSSDRFLYIRRQVPKIRSISVDGALAYESIEDFSGANTSVCPLDSTFFSAYPQTPCVTVQVDNLSEGAHTLVATTEWVRGTRDYRSGLITTCPSSAVYETVSPGPGIWYAAYTYKRTK